jgi:hypothetical protein
MGACSSLDILCDLNNASVTPACWCTGSSELFSNVDAFRSKVNAKIDSFQQNKRASTGAASGATASSMATVPEQGDETDNDGKFADADDGCNSKAASSSNQATVVPPPPTKPPKTYAGLANQGATCYMNSLLQVRLLPSCLSLSECWSACMIYCHGFCRHCL